MTLTTPIEPEREQRRGPRALTVVVAMVVLLVIIAAGALIATRSGDDDSAPAAPSAVGPWKGSGTIVQEGTAAPFLSAYKAGCPTPPSAIGCDSLALIGWTWDGITGVQTFGTTKWVEASVTGTWDGKALTVTSHGAPFPMTPPALENIPRVPAVQALSREVYTAAIAPNSPVSANYVINYDNGDNILVLVYVDDAPTRAWFTTTWPQASFKFTQLLLPA